MTEQGKNIKQLYTNQNPHQRQPMMTYNNKPNTQVVLIGQ